MPVLTAQQQRRRKNARAFKRDRKRIGLIKGTKPERDPEYLAFLRTLACLMCAASSGASWSDSFLKGGAVCYGTENQKTRTEAAHTGPHGMSQKASDYDAIPLCHHHHQEAKDAQGKDRNWFEKHGLDRDTVIATLRARYEKERAA